MRYLCFGSYSAAYMEMFHHRDLPLKDWRFVTDRYQVMGLNPHEWESFVRGPLTPEQQEALDYFEQMRARYAPAEAKPAP